MQKILIIALLILITANCKGIENLKTSSWYIQKTTPKSELFKEGMLVDFTGNSIRFSNDNQTNKYPVIVSENRMVIEMEYTKWLFEIEMNDSILVLRELYEKTPIVISLVKIKNQKNHKS